MVLTQKLVEKNKITKEQAQELQKEFANFQGSEESFLFAKKIVSEEDINAIKAEIYNIPYFDKIELLEVSSDVLFYDS